MSEFNELFAALREVAPDYRSHVDAALGSDVAGHRDAIRANLVATLGPADSALRDLNVLPDLPDWSVSISHTPGRGGWLAVPKPHGVGFDLEVRERVREAVVRRMCSPEEIERASDLALLWSAKEALFKALARGQPATLSQLKIVTWQNDGSLTRFTSDRGARGVAQSAGPFAAAWCIC